MSHKLGPLVFWQPIGHLREYCLVITMCSNIPRRMEVRSILSMFFYVAALLANSVYIAKFKDDLIRPGLRVPLTAHAALFVEAVKLER
jgi:hypothetical protein